MTAISTDMNVATNCAAAIVRCLPGANLTPGNPEQGVEALTNAIPGPGSKALSTRISGELNGTMIIVVCEEIVEQIENSPVGKQNFVAGLEPALADAIGAITGTLGETRAEAPQELDAEVALANAPGADGIIVVPITSMVGIAGSVVLLLEPKPEQESGAAAASFETLGESYVDAGSNRAVELLNDVEMGVTAELGRTRMTIRQLLSLQPGSIVELDRAAGSPVDVLVNGTIVARGEVVVIDEEFGVRITEIIGYDGKPNG